MAMHTVACRIGRDDPKGAFDWRGELRVNKFGIKLSKFGLAIGWCCTIVRVRNFEVWLTLANTFTTRARLRRCRVWSISDSARACTLGGLGMGRIMMTVVTFC